MMDLQLEILCRDNCTTNTPNSDNNLNRIQALFDKIIERFRPDKHNVDTWEIPIEKIKKHDMQGCGAQGKVFYGKMNQKPVAIKKVEDKSLTTRSYLRTLNHENVIKFKGVNSENNYIIMEWCQYGNLHNMIHSGRQIPADTLAKYGSQIANGMSYLHSKNIIHCDLKPSNILITNNNVLKISDFESHQLSRDVCRSGWCGSLPYMAPEMIHQKPFSFPVDVWSYGVVLWEILTGHEPNDSFSEKPALVWALFNDSNETKLHIPSSFPAGYRAILEGCWQSQPKNRLTFPKICDETKAAMQEINNISITTWIPLQSQWNNSIRKMRTKINSDEHDLIVEKQRIARDRKQNDKTAKRNQDIYLSLQECSMLLAKFSKELEKKKQDLDTREQDLEKRERELERREHESKSIFERSSNQADETNLNI